MLFVFVRHHHVRTREQTFVDMHFLVSWETCGHILIRCHSVLMSLQCGLGISLPFVGRRVGSRKFMPYRVIADDASNSSRCKVRKAKRTMGTIMAVKYFSAEISGRQVTMHNDHYALVQQYNHPEPLQSNIASEQRPLFKKEGTLLRPVDQLYGQVRTDWNQCFVTDCSLSHPAGHKPFTCSHSVFRTMCINIHAIR